jgi:hypothetical protein
MKPFKAKIFKYQSFLSGGHPWVNGYSICLNFIMSAHKYTIILF